MIAQRIELSSSHRLFICGSAEHAAAVVSRQIIDVVRDDRRAVLGLATGGTPVGVYGELVRRHAEGQFDPRDLTTFNLDEYVGLGADHPQSFAYFMHQHLFGPLGLSDRQTNIPSGIAADLDAEAERYEDSIRSHGGIAWQLLGIGDNGHIAFNEPGSAMTSRTRVVKLTEATITANSRFFDTIDDVPRAAITMGIGSILEAREVTLMAVGANKADAIQAAIQGTPHVACPASLLQNHVNVNWVLDHTAASKLQL